MNLVNPYRFSSGAYSAEAQAVFDNMAALTSGEKTDMAKLIDDNQAVGNWAMVDDIWGFTLNSTDRLIRWKSGLSAVNVNSATFGTNGVTSSISPARYIDTGFSSADGTNFTVADRAFHVFFNDITFVSSQMVFGHWNGSSLATGLIVQTATQFRCFGNSTNQTQQNFTDPMTNILCSGTVLATTTTGYREGGIEIGSTVTGTPASEADNGNFYLGARNNNGVADSNSVLTSPFLAVTGHSGFDYTTWNSSIRTFLTARGMTL